MKKLNNRWKALQIGSDRPSLDLEATEVTVKKTFAGRIKDAAWMVGATLAGLTIFHAAILPFL